MTKLKWTRVYEPGGRTISHYVTESAYYNMTLRIWPRGGHITNRRFILEIACRKQPMFNVRFYKLMDAKEWAEAFFSQNGATIKAIQVTPLYS